MEDIRKLLAHPLVIIAAVFIGAIAFYYIASPYKNCVRKYVNYQIMPDPTVTKERLEAIGAASCNKKHSW
ncbi:MAG: hypothetical protein ACJ0HT_00155 [Alphaproteobacteria bacterium]